MKKQKYNTILRVIESEGITNISFVTSDHQEFEIDVETKLLTTAKDFQGIPAIYFTHPACCEHPTGCPEETNTQKQLRKFNENTRVST